MLNRELLLKIKEYIETTEVNIDGEFGSCRDLEELINENKMPELYNEILNELKNGY